MTMDVSSEHYMTHMYFHVTIRLGCSLQIKLLTQLDHLVSPEWGPRALRNKTLVLQSSKSPDLADVGIGSLMRRRELRINPRTYPQRGS